MAQRAEVERRARLSQEERLAVEGERESDTREWDASRGRVWGNVQDRNAGEDESGLASEDTRSRTSFVRALIGSQVGSPSDQSVARREPVEPARRRTTAESTGASAATGASAGARDSAGAGGVIAQRKRATAGGGSRARTGAAADDGADDGTVDDAALWGSGSPSNVPSFHAQVAVSARRFLKVYLPYVKAVDDTLSNREQRTASTSYDQLKRLSAIAAGGHAAEYRSAMRAATVHIQDFASALGGAIEPSQTSLRIDKSKFLVYLMDATGETAYCAFPIALGVRSDQGPKERPGDLRSPETPPGERTAGATPFYAHPLVPDDPDSDEGCITRGIGVTSDDPRFNYLQGWTVMLHGTPDSTCIGRRASHGCIRLLPAHITVLYDYIRDGTRIVFAP